MDKFRCAAWPGLLPDPALPQLADPLHLIDGLIVYTQRSAGDARPIAPELAIREAVKLRIDEPAAVISFVQDHGWVESRPDDGVGTEDRLLQLPHADYVQRVPAPATLARWRAEFAVDEEQGELLRIVDLEVVRLELARVQWCALHLLNDQPDEPIHPSFVLYLNRGVSVFRPGLALPSMPRWWEPGPDLISALYCQLFNLAIEADAFRECPNCGDRFFRQRGRAKHGQHRTASGVTYCSTRCSNTGSNRAWRERQRAKHSTGED
jgi:hypothetical protein